MKQLWLGSKSCLRKDFLKVEYLSTVFNGLVSENFDSAADGSCRLGVRRGDGRCKYYDAFCLLSVFVRKETRACFKILAGLLKELIKLPTRADNNQILAGLANSYSYMYSHNRANFILMLLCFCPQNGYYQTIRPRSGERSRQREAYLFESIPSLVVEAFFG